VDQSREGLDADQTVKGVCVWRMVQLLQQCSVSVYVAGCGAGRSEQAVPRHEGEQEREVWQLTGLQQYSRAFVECQPGRSLFQRKAPGAG
jgi:hypothetical protein